MRVFAALIILLALAGCAGSGSDSSSKPDASVLLAMYTGVEVRIMAVPDAWAPQVAGTFKKEVMNDLADLGEKMGADPASWTNGVPD